VSKIAGCGKPASVRPSLIPPPPPGFPEGRSRWPMRCRCGQAQGGGEGGRAAAGPGQARRCSFPFGFVIGIPKKIKLSLQKRSYCSGVVVPTPLNEVLLP
jgi:hypothetical protein